MVAVGLVAVGRPDPFFAVAKTLFIRPGAMSFRFSEPPARAAERGSDRRRRRLS